MLRDILLHPHRPVETRRVWNKFSSLQCLWRRDKVQRVLLHHVPSTIHLHPATRGVQNTWRSHVRCLEQWLIVHVQQKQLFFFLVLVNRTSCCWKKKTVGQEFSAEEVKFPHPLWHVNTSEAMGALIMSGTLWNMTGSGRTPVVHLLLPTVFLMRVRVQPPRVVPACGHEASHPLHPSLCVKQHRPNQTEPQILFFFFSDGT